ncbi:C1 family peptidase [Parapedobacter sp. 2B3]|uniref:C1 family peptidase n=1 Tax=Parapedobacter sp. 2B3 TaxID=3342381 RepID=UPI0035B67278
METKHNWLAHLKTTTTLSVAALLFLSCSKDSPDNPDDGNPDPEDTEYAFGWSGTDNAEEIPSNIFLGFGNANLPASHSIVDRLPPIGDQGQYGTCVTWAAGYNLKTMLNAMDNNWTTADLSDDGRQASPKDLFLSIPANLRGSNCNGTNFEPAFQQMIDRGIATLATAPYTGLGNCTQAPDAAATQEAANNRLSNFRKINMETAEIKTYLSQNRPVVFGARLADNFMTWRGDQVITSHSTFDNVGMHAYHAMVIVGYDDSKGPNGAFRVVNSWGRSWGDTGFIWVDYRFMTNPEFGMMGFVATNGQSEDFDPVDPPVAPTGEHDLVPWNVSDIKNPESTNQRSRQMNYNVYNIGSSPVNASQRWNICYIYYNAFDAEDFGIILYDEYTDQYGTLGQNGELTTGGYGESGNWWNHINLSPQQGVAELLFNSESVRWTYTMPNISGFYYLVCIADAFDTVAEADEANNYFFLTDESGWPLVIGEGVIYADAFGNSKQQAVGGIQKQANKGARMIIPEQKGKQKNAYTPGEISGMITTLKKNGKLKAKIQEFQSERGKGGRD